MDDHDGVTRLARGSALALAAALLSSCAGGAGLPNAATPGTYASSLSASARGKRVLASFAIRIPRRRHRAHYVSPYTQSVQIVVDPGAGQTVVASNLTPGSPNCIGGVCTIVVSLSSGLHHFNVSAYDGPLSGGVPSGNLLSQNLAYPFTVRLGAANRVGIVLQGVPKSLVVTPDLGQDINGSQSTGFQVYGAYKGDGATLFPRTFTVYATDADGNLITGSGAPQIAMASAATSIFANGVASPYSSNRITITPATFPAGTYDGSWVPFTVTATPASDAGASAISIDIQMRLMARNGPVVAVTDQTSLPGGGRVWAFDESGKPIANVQSAFDASGNLMGPAGIAYGSYGAGQFLVVSEFGYKLYAFDSDGTSQGYATLTNQPLGICYDDVLRNFYITNAGAVVNLYGGSTVQTTSGDWLEISNAEVPQAPWGCVVYGGEVYVADEASGAIEMYTLDGVDLGARVDIKPTGIALVSGQLYFTERANHDVRSDGVSFPSGAFPNLTSPFGIVQDPVDGYVYVVDYEETGTTSAVRRYDLQGNEVPLPAGAFVGPDNPLSIAISY